MKRTYFFSVLSACLVLTAFATGCGKLNPKTEGQIYSALEAKSQEFQKCYEKALKKDRNLKGSVDLKVKFDPKGTRAESVEVTKSDIQDKKMLKCVSRAADNLSIEDAPGVFIEGMYSVTFQFTDGAPAATATP